MANGKRLVAYHAPCAASGGHTSISTNAHFVWPIEYATGPPPS